jgi:hyperosmotically inducible periplasmic protein
LSVIYITKEIAMRQKSAWTLTLICAAALTAGCDRADTSNDTLGEKVDRAGDKIAQEAAEARDSIDRSLDKAEDKLEAGAERTADAVERSTDNMRDRAAVEGEQLSGSLHDSAITVKAKSALVADPDLSALNISVDTKNAVVTLRGDASSATAVEKATTLVKDIEGVVDVDNQLKVNPRG